MNWSLKHHIRLRTISSLVPIHITHVYVQWIPYSFMWLYLFKVLHLLNHMLIKHKKIFEYFNCFWKVFLFWKISKISKTIQLCFRLTFTGQFSRETLVASLLRSSRHSLPSQAPSRKKDLQKFQIFWGFSIFATHFGDWFASGSFNHEFTQNASRLTREWTF